MTVTAPPRPPRPSDPVTHGEFEALVEALIEEARQRARHRRRRNGAIVTLVALVGVALFGVLGRSAESQTASPAVSARLSSAAQPGTSRIAYISEPPGGGYCGALYVMNPDGSGQRRLVRGGENTCGSADQAWSQDSANPAWSPDGRRLAIVRNELPAGKPYTNDFKIYVVNADGSGKRRLTKGTDMEWSPAWSPDGRKIAFAFPADGNSDIYVVNADGSEQQRLTQTTVGAGDPVWSPDGRKIVFTSDSQVWVMNADGSGQQSLTRIAGRSFASPAWSPDGRRIAFKSGWQLWVMNADGSGKRRLTRTGAHNFHPAWSPDGRRIAFERAPRQPRQGVSYKPGSAGYEVYVMNADGSGQQRLRRGGSGPKWSPDGRTIAFVSKRGGNRDIWVMNADGSGQRNLTGAAGNRESDPVWSPALK